MATTPPVLTQVPAPSELRYGLLTVAEATGRLNEFPGGRSASGVQFDAQSCGVASPYPIACDTPPAKTFSAGDPTIEALPFAVYSSMVCGTAGYTTQEFEDKARRNLRAGEQGAVEEAFWTGAPTLGIDFLADSTVVTPVNDTLITSVVSELEEWLYSTVGYGFYGVIHAPVAYAAYAATAMQIVQDGAIKRTPYGTVWVFGGGYPLGTPATQIGQIAITGQVSVWRAGDAFVYPAEQTIDKATNQQYVIAEREYAVGFDCHAAIATFEPIAGI